MNGLGLENASAVQGFEIIPAHTQVVLTMKIKPGNIGLEGLLKRSADGRAEMLDVEFTILGGDYDKRKIWSNLTLDGAEARHVKAGNRSRELLRAIFEAAHGLDPKDTGAPALARLAEATLAGLNGATFIAIIEVEKGKKRENGDGFWPDKNVIGKVLRIGDPGYQQLDQPLPAPIERSVPPQPQAQTPSPAAANGTPAVAAAAIAKPAWAQ